MRESIESTSIRTISVVTMECIDNFDDIPASSLGHGVEITNYTTKVITVATRCGLFHEVKPQRLPRHLIKESGILFKLNYTGRRDQVTFDSTCILNEPTTELGEYLASNYETGPVTRVNSTSASLFLSSAQLNDNGGIVYLNQIDIQVSFEHIKAPPHPFSPTGMHYHVKVDNQHYESLTNVSTTMELVDNENELSTKYLNIMGDIYGLVPERSNSRPSGLYITKNGVTSLLGKRKELDVEHVPIDKISERLGQVYSSAADAKALGSATEVKRRELEEEELRYKKEKIELELEIVKNKRSSEILSAKAGKVKHRRDFERADWEERKTHNSQIRKETVEIIKIIPSVISVVASLLAFYSKLKD